jgi:A/G-specific adenine glycosylase
MLFSKLLIQWYLQNKRDLPWRNTNDSYRIWLSEIILQQTRVAQGLPYYFAFIETFPTVFDLANADEEQVLKLWQGLGYYSRARNLHATAKYVVQECNGVFPNQYKDLLLLKGVGEYTAAAIASFSNNEPVAVVDGNVYRVLARCFGITTDISSSIAKKEFTKFAFELMDKKQPLLFNQAIMEFGALQCVPKNPNCSSCVMNNSCVALQKDLVDTLPVKTKKVSIKKRFFNYIVFKDDKNCTLFQKRVSKAIWQNLYEFPLIETIDIVDEEHLLELLLKQQMTDLPLQSISLLSPEVILHKLSHQHLNIQFFEVKVKGILQNGLQYSEFNSLPFPIVIHNFIEKNWPSVLKN